MSFILPQGFPFCFKIQALFSEFYFLQICLFWNVFLKVAIEPLNSHIILGNVLFEFFPELLFQWFTTVIVITHYVRVRPVKLVNGLIFLRLCPNSNGVFLVFPKFPPEWVNPKMPTWRVNGENWVDASSHQVVLNCEVLDEVGVDSRRCGYDSVAARLWAAEVLPPDEAAESLPPDW